MIFLKFISHWEPGAETNYLKQFTNSTYSTAQLYTPFYSHLKQELHLKMPSSCINLHKLEETWHSPQKGLKQQQDVDC